MKTIFSDGKTMIPKTFKQARLETTPNTLRQGLSSLKQSTLVTLTFLERRKQKCARQRVYGEPCTYVQPNFGPNLKMSYSSGIKTPSGSTNSSATFILYQNKPLEQVFIKRSRLEQLGKALEVICTYVQDPPKKSGFGP